MTDVPSDVPTGAAADEAAGTPAEAEDAAPRRAGTLLTPEEAAAQDALAHAVLARARAAAWEKGLKRTPRPGRGSPWREPVPDDATGSAIGTATGTAGPDTATAGGETAAEAGVRRRAGAGAPPSDGDPEDPKAWRPGPGLGWAGSGAHPSRRDPQAIGRLGEQLVNRRGWRREMETATVVNRWQEIVGVQVAEHCEVETFADGELVVRTSSTAWATQVRMLIPQLERRIGEVAGPDAVTKITVLGPGGPSWKHGRFSVRGGRGPRDTYG
jgi:predicted nucleic acid-binding Zn ribbon protein